MKMTLIIKFDSHESDGDDGVEDEARFHNNDEPRLASEALFLVRHLSRFGKTDNPFQYSIQSSGNR